MKMTKKILALVMAIAMLFSLCMFSVSAYDNTGKVRVEIRVDGVYAWHKKINQTDIAGHRSHDIAPVAPYTANVDHVYYVPTVASGHTTSFTVADAILTAYLEQYSDYDDDEVHYSWYENDLPGGGTSWGIYFDTFEGLQDDSYTASGTYYYMGSTQIDGITMYQYYWVGNAWQLTINDVEVELYSSEYELGTSYDDFDDTQPETIVLDYTEVTSDPFYIDHTIPGALPAP